MDEFISQHPTLVALTLVMILFAVHRWQVRSRIYQISRRIDDILRNDEVPSIDFLSNPKIRKHVSILRLLGQIDEKLNRLITHQEDGTKDR